MCLTCFLHWVSTCIRSTLHVMWGGWLWMSICDSWLSMHASFVRICACRIFSFLPHFSHNSAKCAHHIFSLHNLVFLTAILILFVFILPIPIRFCYLDRLWSEMGQLVSSNSVPYFCHVFHVYAICIFIIKMPHKTDMPNCCSELKPCVWLTDSLSVSLSVSVYLCVSVCVARCRFLCSDWSVCLSVHVCVCQQSYLLLLGIPSPTHSFIPGLKPSFSANPSHCSPSFLST